MHMQSRYVQCVLIIILQMYMYVCTVSSIHESAHLPSGIAHGRGAVEKIRSHDRWWLQDFLLFIHLD